MRAYRIILALVLAWTCLASPAAAQSVRVKDLGRFLGWRDNALIGYGIVTGLAGSGDSPRNEATRQALKNALSRLGANLTPDQVQSRNVAAVTVTAVLPPSAHVGDKIDVTVSSSGDARSLAGGTLLMTPLMGPDKRPYALAQGALVVGGYRFDADQNREQKNHPTTAVLPAGATVETPVEASLLDARQQLTFILKDPDVITAERIKDGINASLGFPAARVRDADTVSIDGSTAGPDIYRLVAQVESVAIQPDVSARVVINERTGTVVAGGGVQISSVVVSQGDIKVSVTVDHEASQPYGYAGFTATGGGVQGVRSLIVTNTKLQVAESSHDAVVRFPNTTVADLVEALSRAHVDTRGVISVLQAIKAAGALHADIIVQ